MPKNVGKQRIYKFLTIHLDPLSYTPLPQIIIIRRIINRFRVLKASLSLSFSRLDIQGLNNRIDWVVVRLSDPLTQFTQESLHTENVASSITSTSIDIEESSLAAESMSAMTDSEDLMSAKELQRLVEKQTKEKRTKLVKKFVDALTLHGYAQFHEASGVRKVLWAIILSAMILFIVRLTYLSYRWLFYSFCRFN